MGGRYACECWPHSMWQFIVRENEMYLLLGSVKDLARGNGCSIGRSELHA